jgi:uroporphyrinogen-III synthase
MVDLPPARSGRPPVVGITADRRWEEQAGLFRRRGIEVRHGPSMRTIDLAASSALRTATEQLVADPPDVLVATTGAGMRAWFAAAEGWGLLPDLLAAFGHRPSGTRGRDVAVIARGAKAASAVRQAGLDVAWRAPSESMAEVVDHLAERAATAPAGLGRLALQLFDPDDHPSTLAIRALEGVTAVVEVPVYQWAPPDDPGPALALVQAAIAGDLDALTFTIQPAVRFLFALAASAGQLDPFRDALASGRVLAACIGPVCAEALLEAGVPADAVAWPEPFRLPPMVRLVAERLGIESATEPAATESAPAAD